MKAFFLPPADRLVKQVWRVLERPYYNKKPSAISPQQSAVSY